MDLGQSTVLGLAIVGDDGGVDEAEYHNVSRPATHPPMPASLPGFVCVGALPPIRFTGEKRSPSFPLCIQLTGEKRGG